MTCSKIEIGRVSGYNSYFEQIGPFLSYNIIHVGQNVLWEKLVRSRCMNSSLRRSRPIYTEFYRQR